MTDIAKIGFAAETRELEDARKKLEALKPAAQGAEKAAQELKDELKKNTLALQQIAAGTDKAGSGLKKLKGVAYGVDQSFQFLKGTLTGIISTLASAVTFGALINEARETSKAVGELSTLLDANSTGLSDYAKSADELAEKFGTDNASQVKAFYQAISAGANNVADATATVDTANKLAIGGLTDVTTGVNILTTATNAYSASNLTAAQASDALFVGMKAGKTTISELAGSLGNSISIAEALKVSFDTLVAAVSTITLRGVSTSEAVTSLRAALSAIAKPSSEAAELAKKLGLEFNSTALKTKGLSVFLDDVSKKTGGSTSKLLTLFGGTEALKSVLGLTGESAGRFAEILDQMTRKAGSTDEAFKKMAETLDFRLKVALNKIGNAFEPLGNLALATIVPIAESIAFIANDTIPKFLNGTSAMIPQFMEIGSLLTIAFGPIITGYVAALIFGIGVSLYKAIIGAASAMTIFALANPFTALALGFAAVVAVAYAFRDDINKIFGTDVIGSAKNGVNFILGSFFGAFESIQIIWNQLPALIGGAAIGAANAAILAVNGLVNKSIEAINQLITSLPEWARGGSKGITFRLNDQQGPIENKFATGNQVTGAVIAETMARNIAVDRVGMLTAKLNETTTAIGAAATGAKRLGNALGGAAGGDDDDSVAGGAGKAEKQLTALQKIAAEFTKLSEPFTQATTAFNAAKTALENGIITNERYAESIGKIQAAFLAAGGTSEQWSKIVEKNTDDVGKKLNDLAEKSLKKVGDEFIDLAFTGKANFGDLALSIVKDLAKIAFQAIIVKPLLGAFGGFLGGFGVKAANGMAFDGAQAFANGGTFTNSVINRPTPFAFADGAALGVMGEAGPEAIMPLKRGSDGALGVQMHGGNSRAAPTSPSVNIENHYKIEGAISSKEIVEQIRSSSQQTLEETKRSIVGWISQYNQDGII